MNHILTELCRLKLGGPVIMPHGVDRCKITAFPYPLLHNNSLRKNPANIFALFCKIPRSMAYKVA